MSAYLDASVLYAIIVRDVHRVRLMHWFETRPRLALSEWTVTEVSSAFSHRVRLNQISQDARNLAEHKLENWLALQTAPLVMLREDFREARRLLRCHGLLRAPDALHLALVSRLGLDLATFDERLANVAQAQGVNVVNFGDLA